jgi:hypothetical protein
MLSRPRHTQALRYMRVLLEYYANILTQKFSLLTETKRRRARCAPQQRCVGGRGCVCACVAGAEEALAAAPPAAASRAGRADPPRACCCVLMH